MSDFGYWTMYIVEAVSIHGFQVVSVIDITNCMPSSGMWRVAGFLYAA
jgi:hypothetical protein